MAEPATAREAADPPERASRLRFWALLALLVLASVPLLVSAVRVGRGWVPQGDDATIVLRGDDLFTSHSPLVGMPSSVGEAVDTQVHHPGPMEFQAIGLLAALDEGPRVAVVVVSLVNLASVIVTLLWARRVGGPSLLAAAAVVVTALAWSLRGPILVTPFNPYVAILPFLACLVSLVAAWCHQRWALTSAVVFGSWAAQAHLTTTGPVVAATVAAVAVATVRLLLTRWRGGSTAPLVKDRRQLFVGLGVALLCWAAPLLDVVVNEGGNPKALLQTSDSLEDETIGLERALDIVVHAVTLRPVWAQAGADSLDLLAAPSTSEYRFAGLLAIVAFAVAVGCWRSRSAVTVAIGLVAASLLAGGVLTAKIPDRFFNTVALHNYLWLWPASAVLWVATAAGLAHLLGRRTDRRPPVWAPLGAALAITALVAGISLGPLHRSSGTASSVYMRALSPQVLESLDQSGAYLIDLDPRFEVYGLGTGLLWTLEREGYDVRVGERFEPRFGEHRIDDGARRQVLSIELGHAGELAPPEAGAQLVASYEPPPDLLLRRERAEDELVQAIERQGGTVVASGEEITPEEARHWVESGGFISALTFSLADPRLASLPASDELLALLREPVASVAVYLARPS